MSKRVDINRKMYYTAYEYPYPCIYKLVFGEEFYIGQTVNLKQRIQAHVSSLNSGYANLKMQKAYERNNHDFEVEIVEEISPDSTPEYLAEREIFFIKTLKPTINHEKVGNYGENTRVSGRKMIREDLVMNNAEAVKRHHAKLDEFKIRPYKDEGQIIRKYAETHNMSIQTLFFTAIREYMKNHPEEMKGESSE